MSNSHYHKVANSRCLRPTASSSGTLIERWKLLVKQSRKYANRTTPTPPTYAGIQLIANLRLLKIISRLPSH